MDPNLVQYLMGKFPQLQNQSVDPTMQPGGMSQMPPQQPGGMSVDPSLQNAPSNSPLPVSGPASVRSPASQNVVPTSKDVNDDIGTLSDDELARYGIRSPEELAALKQQRIQMGNDLANQSNNNVLAKVLNQASDNINTSGNRIIAGNASNNAPAMNQALDQNLKDQQQKITALDDANKIGDTDYNRLKDIDDKRLKIQELRDSSKDRNAALAMRQQEINAYKQANIGARNDRFQTDQDRKDDDQLAKFSKALNGVSASSRNALGRSALTLQAARSVQALAGDDPKQYDKLSPQQVYEIARGYDKVVSGGNPTISGTAHLIPPAAMNSLANFNQWLTSNNTGAGQGSIVQQMVQGSKREAAVSRNLQKHMVDSLLPAYSNLRKRRGDDMDAIVAGVNGSQSDDVGQILNQAGVPHFGQQGNQPPPPGGMSIDPNAIRAEMQRRQQQRNQ